MQFVGADLVSARQRESSQSSQSGKVYKFRIYFHLIIYEYKSKKISHQRDITILFG